MSVIARERGVDPKHLQPLFEAVGHDPNVPLDRYEQAIRSAVDALLARARDPVAPSNDGEAVDHAIRVARARSWQSSISRVPLPICAPSESGSAEERISRARGEARLAIEEGNILEADALPA